MTEHSTQDFRIVPVTGPIGKAGRQRRVDLFLGNSAGTVRVTENTTLGLDTLKLTNTGAETVVEIQFNLPEGTILGDVNKMSPASKYDVPRRKIASGRASPLGY